MHIAHSLLTVDWQQDNILHGRYLAELTKEVLVDLEASKYQHAEYRISIYGRKYVEWDILAAWYCQNKLYSDNVLWLIQVSLVVLSTVLLETAQNCSGQACARTALPGQLIAYLMALTGQALHSVTSVSIHQQHLSALCAP
jgi:hypothetical protein